LEHNSYYEAIDILKRLLRYYPGSFQGLFLLGLAYKKLRKYKEAANALKRLIKLNPQNIEAHLEYSGVAEALSDYSDCIAAFHNLLNIRPTAPQVLCRLAEMYLLSGDLVSASTYFQKTLENHPLYSRAWLGAAKTLYAMDDRKAASDAINNVISFATPQDLNTLLDLCEWLLKIGESNIVLQQLHNIVHNFPVNEETIIRISKLLESIGTKEENLKLLKAYFNQQGGKSIRKRILELEGKAPAVIDSSNKRVVFVCDTPRAREVKFAYGLKKSGWEVYLLYSSEPNFDFTLFFDSYKKYNSAEHALYEAEQYAPRLCHVFSLAADKTSMEFIKEKFVPIIFDTNDVFGGSINEAFSLVSMQRYCIENADGLCCRDLQIVDICKSLGYKRSRKNILMQEYTWNDPEYYGGPVDDKRWGEEPTIVAIGNFPIEKKGQGVGLLEISKALTAHKIHFHIYPHWFYHNISDEEFSDLFSDYIELQESTPYFRLHRPIAMTELVYTISKYDFGFGATAEATLGIVHERSPTHFRFGGSGRNVDYLDALLPVISTRNLCFQYRRLNQYGLAIDGGPPFLDNPIPVLEKFRNEHVIEQLKKARKQESVLAHIPRLIRFYESF
ncbi:MAG: tetratricopeptide repeat protein, partial [Candidatus Dadabacteria bacterium]